MRQAREEVLDQCARSRSQDKGKKKAPDDEPARCKICGSRASTTSPVTFVDVCDLSRAKLTLQDMALCRNCNNSAETSPSRVPFDRRASRLSVAEQKRLTPTEA